MMRSLTAAIVALVLSSRLALAADLPPKEPIPVDPHDVISYGKACAELIAEVPPFNCLDGEIVPITVNGRTPERYTPGMTCDRPAYLPYPETTDGQCAPYTRLRTVRDDDIQMLLYCRRMYVRDQDSPYFDSIEIIMHNVASGSTCFFISKNFGGTPEGDDGRRVPPPTEEVPPDGFISARELWATPQEVADHGCIFCHDSDPWMHTPWIAQTEQLPADPHGYHSVDVGGPFLDWPKPMSVSTRGNACTGCHRIGSLNTCLTQDIPTFGEQPAKMLQSIGAAPHGVHGAEPGSIGKNPPQVLSEWGQTWPHKYWSPDGQTLPEAVWHSIYDKAIADLERCCNDPGAPGCIVEPIDKRGTIETARKRIAPS